MKHRTHLLTCLIITLLSYQFSAAQEVSKEGSSWVGQFEKTFKMKPGGHIYLDKVRGDISITSWERNEVRIHEKKEMDIFSKNEAITALRLSESGCKLKDNTLTIGGEPFNRKWIQSTFEIFVPYQFNCNLETEGGDVSVHNIQGEVIVLSGGGDISIEDIDGSVHAQTGGGDVDINDITQKTVVKTGGGDVHVETIEGAVDISSGGGDISAVDISNQLNISTGGGDVDISEIEGDLKIQIGGGDVDISEVTGNVTIQTGGGDVDISEIEGESNIQVGGGDINISEAAGNVITRTGGGDISISEIKGDVQANSGGGDIEATEIHGGCFVHTGGGDIELLDINGAVEAKSAEGDIEVAILFKEPQKDYHVNIETDQGDIDLSLPEKFPATIEATIKTDYKEWDDNYITSDFPLTITTEKSVKGYHTIVGFGEINKGGNKVNLKTGEGDITIQKQ